MRRSMSWLLAIVVAGGLGVAGPVGRAAACSCVALEPGQALAMADAAVIGVVIGSADPRAGEPIIGSADPIVYAVHVEQSLKGDAGEGLHIRVTTSREGASCGYPMDVGERHRLHLVVDGRTLTTSLCSGNELLAENVPVPVVSPAEESAQPPPTSVLVAGAVALLVLAVSALAFLGGRRRGASPPDG